MDGETENEKVFRQINVKPAVKRQINLIAAAEGRDVYSLVSDMVEIYKAVTLRAAGKTKAAKTEVGEKSKPVTIAEYIAATAAKN